MTAERATGLPGRRRRRAGGSRTRAALAAGLSAGVLIVTTSLWLRESHDVTGALSHLLRSPPGNAFWEDGANSAPGVGRLLGLLVPLGSGLVCAAALVAGGRQEPGARLRCLVVVGTAAAVQLFSYGMLLRDLEAGRFSESAVAALAWDPRLCAVLVAVIVGSAAWASAAPFRRALSLRARAALVAGCGAALTLPFALTWAVHTGGSGTGNSYAFDWGLGFWSQGVAGILAIIAWVATGQALRPVESIRLELEEITARSLARRVPVPKSGDEITSLATTTNSILDRLETAAELQQKFIADASHELRSPLATIRASLEASLTHPQGVDWDATAKSVLRNVERLQDLSEDLLLLARLDGAVPARLTTVNLTDVAHDLTEEYRHLRHSRRLDIVYRGDADTPACVVGNPLQLERMLRNLLDNACRYARTQIEVVVNGPQQAEDGAIVVAVRDDGVGIPAHRREEVFERFSRLEDARARKSGGAGLGLAIAREIATRHGGSLHFVDAELGAHAVGRLPAATV